MANQQQQRKQYTDELFLIKLFGHDADGNTVVDWETIQVYGGEDPADKRNMANAIAYKKKRDEGWTHTFVYHAFMMHFDKDAGTIVDSDIFAPLSAELVAAD